jgi:hypothetical protein
MLKVIIAAAAVVLSVEVVAISFAPGAEIPGTIPVRALKGDRLNTQSIQPVQKTQQPASPAPVTQVRQVRLA